MLDQLTLYCQNRDCLDPSKTQANSPFIMLSERETLVGYGDATALPAKPLSGITDQITTFFEDNNDGPDLLVGAVPFDRRKNSHLIHPQCTLHAQGRLDLRKILSLSINDNAEKNNCVNFSEQPTAAKFGSNVAEALIQLNDGQSELDKVVLSRSLLVEAERNYDLGCLMPRLALDETVTAYCLPLPCNDAFLVGATPELLIEKHGAHIQSHPLAGSARRSPDALQDQTAAQELLKSAKDQHEHCLVVEDILDRLSPYCSQLSCPSGVALTSTASMWHLGTQICGKLKHPETHVSELVTLLHPTPAVCGLPANKAYPLIEQLESYDRGFFAGAVGWCDAAGDGRWMVAIRCAEISGNNARLFAGAGIVRGSTPQSEIAETEAKFAAVLKALDLNDALELKLKVGT